MVSNDCSRVGVNVMLVLGGIRKPVFSLDCPSCECQSLTCIACTAIFHKAANSIECAFPGADDQETRVCY